MFTPSKLINMKKSILILATLAFAACKKQGPEYTPGPGNQPTKFGYVAFYDKTGSKFIELQDGQYIKEHRTGAYGSTCDSLEDWNRHMIVEGVHTYSVFSTYISPDWYRVKDKLLYTGEVNVIYDNCQVITINK